MLRATPISPHLLIYKPQWSSVFSVLHRATGAILGIALIGAIFFLHAASCLVGLAPNYSIMCFFNTYGNWFIISLFIIVIYGFFYHVSNGVRHLIWDFGNGSLLNKQMLKKTALVVLASSLLMTLVFFAGLKS